MRRLVDLSHPIRHGMITYPGLPGPEVSDHLTREASRERYAPGTEFHIGRICMVANTGTYVDVSFHRYPDGADLSDAPLATLADLDGVVVDCRGDRAIGVARLEGVHVTGRAVLLRTDWSRHWGTDAYLRGHPYLDADGAAGLAELGAALVGIDSLNIDATDTGERPAHSRLLAAGIPLVEHLCRLDEVPSEGFRFTAAPPAVVGMGTFPVRAHAVVED